jgi:hypothetical protein
VLLRNLTVPRLGLCFVLRETSENAAPLNFCPLRKEKSVDAVAVALRKSLQRQSGEFRAVAGLPPRRSSPPPLPRDRRERPGDQGLGGHAKCPVTCRLVYGEPGGAQRCDGARAESKRALRIVRLSFLSAIWAASERQGLGQVFVTQMTAEVKLPSGRSS